MARLLQDDKGNTSSTRLITLIMCVGIIFVWGWVCITDKGDLVDIPSGVIWIFAILLFSGVLRKVIEVAGPDAIGTFFKRG